MRINRIAVFFPSTEKAVSSAMGGSSGGVAMPAMNIDVSLGGAAPSAADQVMSFFDAQA